MKNVEKYLDRGKWSYKKSESRKKELLQEFFEKRRIKNPLKREMIEMKVYNFLLKGENTPQERYNLFH